MECRSLIFITVGLIINISHKIDAYFKGIPHDTEVKVNDSTYMNCSTSLLANQVQWRHGKNYIYTGMAILEPYNDRFSVQINTSTGACNLVIRSVQPSDAGTYECVEDEGFGQQIMAQLIVLDDEPVCRSNMHSEGFIGPNNCGLEPEEIKLSCSTTYHGNSLPILRWKANDDNQSNTDGHVTVMSSNNVVTYALTMKSSLHLNNSSYICQTDRASDKHYSCSSDAINILCTKRQNLMSLLALLLVPAFGVIVVIFCRWKKRNVEKPRLKELELQREPDEQQRLTDVDRRPLDDIESEPEERQRILGLVATIRTKAPEEIMKSIIGFTILDNEVFVANNQSSEIEVYDSIKFTFFRRWSLSELVNPNDLASCHRKQCIYIHGRFRNATNEIFRVDLYGKLIKTWSTKIDSGQLSVTCDSNVILAAFRQNKLNEYSPDGQLIREIHLSSDEGFCHPRHAIKLTNGHFIVSHGSSADDNDDALHRVCLVDADGKLLKSFGGKRGSTINQTHSPTYLSVDGNGSVMVAD